MLDILPRCTGLTIPSCESSALDFATHGSQARSYFFKKSSFPSHVQDYLALHSRVLKRPFTKEIKAGDEVRRPFSSWQVLNIYAETKSSSLVKPQSLQEFQMRNRLPSRKLPVETNHRWESQQPSIITIHLVPSIDLTMARKPWIWKIQLPEDHSPKQ